MKAQAFRTVLSSLLCVALLVPLPMSVSAAQLARPEPPLQATESIQIGPLVVLRADPGVYRSYVSPPWEFSALGVRTATIVINYLENETNVVGDYCYSWPTDAQAAFDFAASVWESQINSSVPIVVEACWTELDPGVLGYGGAPRIGDFTGAPIPGTRYPMALANALSGTDLNGGIPEIIVAYSRDYDWYFGTDGNTPSSQYDFAGVVIHELCHGLGFSGSMSVSSGVGSWGSGTGYPTIYDRFTENGAGQSLINTSLFPNPSAALAAQLTSDNLYFNGTNANVANGGTRPKLYAPSTWQQGSSYSHLDEIYNGTENALMTYSLSRGEANHNPGPIAFGVLKDVGWGAGAPPPAPSVTGIAPNSGTNNGTVHITNLTGSDFQAGATVRLTRSGQSDINATNVNVVSASQITCDFNLTGAATGQWNVVVTNPDGQSGTLSNGFSVSFYGKTWDGSSSSDWHTSDNWTPSGVPTYADDVVIPDVSRQPVISSTSDAAVNNLIIESGATLDLTNRELTVEGTLTNNGTLKQTQKVSPGNVTNFLRITNLAGNQIKYLGLDITPSWPETSSWAPEASAGARTVTLTAVSDYATDDTKRSTIVQPLQPSDWVTIIGEDFEGSFPGSWQVFDNDGTTNGEYYWAARSCRPYAGSYSGWAVGGGANGASLSCNSNYPNNADSWMVYGPFSLADATAADLSFKLWLNSESDNDAVCRAASTDGTSFHGSCTSGNSSGWIDRVLDLADVPTLGDLTGQSEVWIALIFVSDGSTTYAEGAYVDDIVLRKSVSAAPDITVDPAALETTLQPGTSTVLPLTLMNNGAAAATFWLQEQDGGFQPTVMVASPNPKSTIPIITVTPPISPPVGWDDPDIGPIAPIGAQDIRASVTSQWTSAAPIPTARSRLAGVTDQGCLLYAIGGRLSGGLYSDENEVYDPQSDSWTTLTPMPTARTNLAAGAINGVIYVPGGYDASEYLSTHEAYDIASDSWSSKAPLPQAASGGVVVAVNGKIYHIGGNTPSGYTTATYEYDPSTDSWSTKAPAPEAFAYAAGTVLNGHIYIAGGWTAYARFWRYDPVGDNWTVLASMNEGRQSPGLVAAGGYIYAFGGGTGWTALDSTEQYDPSTNTWTPRPDSPLAAGRIGMATGWVHGKIWGAGGAPASASVSNVNEYLDEGYADNCGGTADVPWLSEDPISGTLAAGASQVIDVTFDASVVTQTGRYNATLHVMSNDPDTPDYAVPVTMTVAETGIPPVAGFVPSAHSVRPGEPVTFTNTTIGDEPITYLWSFGDGTTSMVKDPVHTYNTTGTYTVTLVAINLYGTDTATDIITVAETGIPPVASFIPSAHSVQVGEPVTFTNTTTGDEPITYLWSFGDGTTSGVKNPSHTYSAAGTYTVTLVAVNAYGTDIASDVITVGAANAPPAASFVPSAHTVQVGEPVTFTNTTVGAEPITYLWSFGDGTTSAVKNPSHTYSAAGTYIVTLVAVNAYGTDMATDVITVEAASAPPVAGFVPSAHIVLVGEPVTFTNTTVGAEPITYQWSFGDGTTSGVKNPSHTYSAAGTYTVTLVAVNAYGTDTASDAITVRPVDAPPLAGFVPSAHTVQVGKPVTFTNTTVGAEPLTYLWSFGDGTTSMVKNPSHTYSTADTYTITLVAINAHGTDTATDAITVIEGGVLPAPVVTSITPNSGVNISIVHITNLAGSNFQVGGSLYLLAGTTVKLTRSGQPDINATNVVVVSASRITCDFDLAGAATGEWNVVVTNPDGQSGTLPNGFTVTAPSTAAPVVTSITPNSGTNDGLVHITNLAGSNFQVGATVKLTRSGQLDINATSVDVVSASLITCDFDLTGAATGEWNVVVTNPDSQSGTLPNGFTVASAELDVSVAISGNQLCTGRSTGVKRCFDISPAAPLTATVRFYFSEAERNRQAANELLVFHYDGLEWIEEPGPYARGGAGDAQYVEAQNVGDFSLFALARAGGRGSTVYMPVVMKRHPPIPDKPVLNPIDNSDNDGNYTVSWNAAYLADTYILEEDDNSSFSSPTTVYSGSGRSWSASGKPSGTYYYRVKASNAFGYSGWSNVQSVTVPAPPTPPNLNPIDNPDGDGNYTVSWDAVSGATSYTLEEDDNSSFSSPTTRYTGSGTSWSASDKSKGTYYYRVKASNAAGSSGWSNVRTVSVTKEPTGPKPGLWKGQGVEFYVTSDRAYVDDFAVRINVSGCGTYKITRTSKVAISNNKFSFSGSFYASGTFNSSTSASGSGGLNRFYISGCGYVSGTFSWSATWYSSQAVSVPSEVVEINAVEPITATDGFAVTPIR